MSKTYQLQKITMPVRILKEAFDLESNHMNKE